jgi:N-acetylglucosaminyldiphosphoundecaprenol N-acetyl-beta-D-mannosaminyltransferase
MNNKVNILGINIDNINPQQFIEKIEELVSKKECTYVCFSNVHTIVTSQTDTELSKITNQSAIVAPDGMPVVWTAKLLGAKQIEKCSGPDMMEEIFKLSDRKAYSHYFYGGTNDTLLKLKEKLIDKYPNIKIVGMYSPPFRPLTKEEDEMIIRQINEANPDFIWVGLGAPKQEKWMAEHCSLIDRGILLGVGAAFNFYAGTVKRAPKWMQDAGLEWFYRLIKEPKRLWKRYLTTNTLFIYYFIKQFINKKNNYKGV